MLIFKDIYYQGECSDKCIKIFKSMATIYQIKCLVTKKCYIGWCKSFYVRKKTHLQHLTRNNHHSQKLQRAWNKYGSNNFIFEIIETDVNQNIILQKEIEYIKKFNSYKKGYNCTPGGEGIVGRFGKYHHNSKYYYLYDYNGKYITKKLMAKGVEKFTKKSFRIPSKKGFCLCGNYVVCNKYQGERFTGHHKIFKYDLNDNLINSYISTTHIKDVNIDDIYYSFRTNKPVNGFIWKSKTSDMQTKQFNDYKVKIEMYNKQNVFEKSFNSITEAYDFLETPINGNISKCLKGKQKTAYGHIWKLQK